MIEADRLALRRRYEQERDKRLRPDGNHQGAPAYFRYIDQWRKSGDFAGLQFGRT